MLLEDLAKSLKKEIPALHVSAICLKRLIGVEKGLLVENGMLENAFKPAIELSDRSKFFKMTVYCVCVLNLQGQGTKGGPAKVEGAEFADLDKFARQLAIKMRRKPSLDPMAYPG